MQNGIQTEEDAAEDEVFLNTVVILREMMGVVACRVVLSKVFGRLIFWARRTMIASAKVSSWVMCSLYIVLRLSVFAGVELAMSSNQPESILQSLLCFRMQVC